MTWTNDKTHFADIKVGDKFISPGGTAIYTKVAKLTARTEDGRRFPMHPRAEVVPEKTATVADILGSWGRM